MNFTALSGMETDYGSFCKNLNLLLKSLSVNYNDLAKTLSFDPSYISRILSGQRRPGNLPKFLADVSGYLARRYSDETQTSVIADLTGCTLQEAASQSSCAQAIRPFLGSAAAQKEHPMTSFLTKLDTFDLNEFMRSIRFEEMKVPTVPFQLPTTKTYHGIREMMQAELDFLRSVVLSRSRQDVILYSDMPMEEMSKDPEFPKKWMFGMAMLLRKGLHLHNIHNVHRPLPEMMLGLESWIPMYMTGQISPYYLRNQTNHIFLHFIRSAGTVAISGEAISGKHANGRYLVARSKDDVAYYRHRAEDLLRRAMPLMHIFRKEQETDFQMQKKKLRKKGGAYRMIRNAPPLFTMSEGLLSRILKRYGLSLYEEKKVLTYYQQ